jgi:hypothetical protein
VTASGRTERLPCRKAEKPRIFTPVGEFIWEIRVKP